ncbi:MAG: DUF2975 domain-containing protein [Bernardetiaceae bacterium]|jgi:hypothetical protein|nr:DUF2975 domain-containing protein [Bernardetiaceae bacterium]
MKLVRLSSAILFYVARALALGYLAILAYLLASVALRLPSFQLLDKKRFVIYYPFTQTRFLLGSQYTAAYLTEMVLVLGVYGAFFWLLGQVFHTFKQPKLFTQAGIGRLRAFCLFNLVVPGLMLGLMQLLATGEDFPLGLVFMFHTVIGVFAFFIMSIFQQGVHLQNEQDLII